MNPKPGERKPITRELNELAMELLVGSQYTDMHVETGLPVMLRRAAGMWHMPTDKSGSPFVVKLESARKFVHGIYHQTDKLPASSKPDWEIALQKQGSLHPAVVLNGTDASGAQLSLRLRCAIQRQSMGDAFGIVLRALRDVPKDIQTLGLPVHLTKMVNEATSGLLVVTGPTGSGKSTTLAAIINEINEERAANILTIEDPIEFEHERKRSIINQREVGVDTGSFDVGVRDALRFAPDVILIGEIRDAETMRAAVRLGSSGHLVVTSMHAPTAVIALRRMMSYLSASEADAHALASCLVGILAQALIPSVDASKGNHLAYELLNARECAGAIAGVVGDQTGAKYSLIEDALRKNGSGGSSPMLASVQKLVAANLVDSRFAAAALVDPQEKALLMRGSNPGAAPSWEKTTQSFRSPAPAAAAPRPISRS